MPMKVLFYGGCHAPILCQIFKRHATSVTADSFEFLVNFKIIDSGKPFPYSDAKKYSTVVMSPINNQGQWNTEHLLEFCRSNGIKTVVFPWLQWNGYFPEVEKSGPKSRQGDWRYKKCQSARDYL